MRTLYLHIGFHKTGTSSLQLALKNNRAQLLAQGFEFVCLGKKGNSSGVIDVTSSGSGISFHLNDRFEKLLAASRGDRVIVSAEHFSYLHSEEAIERVRAVSGRHFDKVRIIVYLRRQDRQAISFRLQAARACEVGRSSSSKLLGHGEGAFPELTADVKIYYDYFAKLRLWEQSFGAEALSVHVFESDWMKGRDIVSDFAALLGEGVVIPACRVNEAISRREFLLSNKLLQLGVAPTEVKRLKPFMREDKTCMRPGRAAARDFFEQFADSNRALNDRFLPHPSGLAFSDDFDAYPLEGNDTLTMRDLADWAPALFAAGLSNPVGLRDALLVERLQARPMADRAGEAADSELAALRGCLAQSADITSRPPSWWRRLKPKKSRDGR